MPEVLAALREATAEGPVDDGGGEETFILVYRDRTGRRHECPSDRETFELIRASDDGLAEILSIEDAYEAHVANYIAFESGVMSLIAQDMVRRRSDYEPMDDARRTAGRLMDNLLSTAFSFTEQAKRRSKEIGGRDLVRAVELRIEALRRQRPAMWIMQWIRGHAQHAGTSVTGIVLGVRRIEGEGEDAVLEYTVGTTLKRAVLKPDRTWSVADRETLEAFLDAAAADRRDGQLALLPLVRAYMAALSELLETLRELFTPFETPWIEANRAALLAMGVPDGGGSSHQAARRRGQRCVEAVQLVHFNIDRIKTLRGRNGSLKALALARIRN